MADHLGIAITSLIILKYFAYSKHSGPLCVKMFYVRSFEVCTSAMLRVLPTPFWYSFALIACPFTSQSIWSAFHTSVVAISSYARQIYTMIAHSQFSTGHARVRYSILLASSDLIIRSHTVHATFKQSSYPNATSRSRFTPLVVSYHASNSLQAR